MNQLTILIVDDDKTTSSILNHMLKPYASTLVTASNGVEGCDLYKKYTPDIILSDINMPQMNGLEMIEKIRKVDEQVKIAIFTDFEKRETLVKAIELGVNQFFSKPFEEKSFSKMMKTLCNEVIGRSAKGQKVRVLKEPVLVGLNRVWVYVEEVL